MVKNGEERGRHRGSRKSESRATVVGFAAVAVAIALAAAYGIWVKSSADADTPGVSASPTSIVVTPDSSPLPVPLDVPLAPPVDDPLPASFDHLSGEVAAQIGVAYAPVGQPDQVLALGAWPSGPAWSTSKVPLALALLRETGEVTPSMRSAITASDNSSAEAMWDQLGGGSAAASKMMEVLAAAGNPQTEVPSERRRSGFSIFGQTDWSLADQARFLAREACDPQAAPVTDLMGQVVSGQRWGLGGIDGAQFKGGWGPGTDGLYLVRQFGVIPTATGRAAVAIAGVADSGGFGDGTAALDRVAAWVKDNVDVGGGCG